MNNINDLLKKLKMRDSSQVKCLIARLDKLPNDSEAVLVVGKKKPLCYQYHEVKGKLSAIGESVFNISTPDGKRIEGVGLSTIKWAISTHAKSLSLGEALIHDDQLLFIDKDDFREQKESEMPSILHCVVTAVGPYFDYKPYHTEKDVFMVSSQKTDDMAAFKDVVSTIMGHNHDKYISGADAVSVIEISKKDGECSWRYSNSFAPQELVKKMKAWLPEAQGSEYGF